MRTVVLALAVALSGTPVGAAAPQASVRIDISGGPASQGQVVVVNISCHCEPDSIVSIGATVFGRELPLSEASGVGTWQALVGVDLETKPGSYPVRVVAARHGRSQIVAARTLTVVKKRFPVRRLNVPPDFVDPPADEMDRIRTERLQLEALFATITTPRLWEAPFHAPSTGRVSGVFGARSILNGQARSPHSGIDFPAQIGTPVAAPAAGVVRLVEPLYFSGNTVVVDHGLGLFSLLAHLSEFHVKVGDRVIAGQIVGLAGSTGRSTGPHLHWTVRLNGARVDPLSLLRATTKR